MRTVPPSTNARFSLPAALAMLSCSVAILAPASALAGADTYRFDPVHTQVWFSADHQHFSHPQGRLRVKDGWFQFDPKDWSASRVDVVIDLASADLGDAKWNDTAKSGAFLDASGAGTAHFVSRGVEQKDATHGVIHGDLTFRGATKPVDVAFTLNRIGNDPYAFKQKAGFSATATLHRSEFGMTRYKEVVGEDISLHFEIEGIRDRDAARPRPEE
ncbi:MAG: YceI family protein [Lysobacterales bacterium]